MSISTMRLTFAAAGLMLAASASGANASYCGDGKTVTFAGIDWESGAFITEVMKTILSKGYDCQVDSIPGNSVTLEQATANNDVQIFAEEWLGRSDVWNKAVEEKKVIAVGKTFVGASEGWFVPDYVVHGDPARNIEAKAAGSEKRITAYRSEDRRDFRRSGRAIQRPLPQLPLRLDLRGREHRQARGLQAR